MSLHLSRIRLAVGLALGGSLLAAPVGATLPVNTDFRGTAVKGYDVVSYFEDGRSAMGSREHTHDWKGATCRFRSAEHRELVAAYPEKYAPQYGGCCAYAVSQRATTDIDPGAWRIVDGKLYLNLSKRVQELWEQDIPGHSARADDNWPTLLAD